jgi:hypothetical protein
MIESIQTFFGKIRGLRGDRQTIINQTMMWRCTVCGNIFKTKEEGDLHGVSSLRCVESSERNKIVPHKIQA